MKKRCALFLTFFLLGSFIGKISAQNYQVQIAAFTQEINYSFFSFAGYSNVLLSRDYNNFIRYSIGEYYSYEEAEKVRIDAIKRGFNNTKIITLNRPDYAYLGDSQAIPFMMVPEKEPLYIRSILFSSNKLGMNKELFASLEETITVMAEHKELKLRIIGHTDEIGEPSVNQAISKKRARIIQNFLLANGIPAYRLTMKVSEEPNPEVYFKNTGLPQNRDFNRRIVITLLDLKDEIVVDDFQKERDSKNGKSLSSIKNLTNFIKFIKLV